MDHPQPLDADSSAAFAQIRLIATDMDGTLTQAEQFRPAMLAALERLQAAALPVVIVTGRSAGWVSGLAHYLPIVGAIAENGGLYFSKTHPEPTFLQPIIDIQQHRQKLSSQFQRLRQRYPALAPSADNQFRLTDWTFDVTGLSQADLHWMATSCEQNGWGFTYSTVQCHIKPLAQAKAAGLAQALSQGFPALKPAQVLTVGDSPNDESLFDAAQFPNSVGVANIRDYLAHLTHQPAYITTQAAGAGFCELVDYLLAAQP
ncbi:MAG: HAD family phosphatase [Leptolyngbya sp. SIO4C1]|nr:HAD family phosphatase [Leptolyngbya sp. SIO4C1]